MLASSPARLLPRERVSPVPPSRFRPTARSLCGNNFARALVLEQFLISVASQGVDQPPAQLGLPLDIAVVGGSSAEPEIRALESHGYLCNVTTYGVDESCDVFLDLNQSPAPGSNVGPKFDLVLCSQVLEHVWNHAATFRWLGFLAGDSALLWVGVPAANRPHGSPGYFSAGFTDEYLANNLRTLGFVILSSGQIGSARLYRGALMTPIWLSVRGYASPLLFAFEGSPKPLRIPLTLRYLPSILRVSMASGRVVSSERCATESWVMARNEQRTDSLRKQVLC